MWLVLLGVALAEVLALQVRIDRVPSVADFGAAARLVRQGLAEDDALAVAPAWADPLLRLSLGDRIPSKMAGRADLAGYRRLWVLSIWGDRFPQAPNRPADYHATVGRITVDRYDFAPSPVVYDFVDHIASARADLSVRGEKRPCTFSRGKASSVRGGLGTGPAAPQDRFVCDGRRPWLWVGATVIEDLSLQPRRCIYQHPQGEEPVSLHFDEVPMGSRVVVYAGLDYHQERDETGAPVMLRIRAAGKEIGRVEHHDGDGMSRSELLLPPALFGSRTTISFEVTAESPNRRAFCWSATIRDLTRREGS